MKNQQRGSFPIGSTLIIETAAYPDFQVLENPHSRVEEQEDGEFPYWRASLYVRLYIIFSRVHIKNWKDATMIDKDMNVLAYISFNGYIWNSSRDTCLYNPNDDTEVRLELQEGAHVTKDTIKIIVVSS